LPIKADRGFVIPAFNTRDVDYESCAVNLQNSILTYHPNANITILTNKDLPVTELTGQALDYFAYKLSPYRQTIKLEADMLMASPCMHWFDLVQHRDVCISTGCLDFYGNQSSTRYYRKFLDNNHLSDIYNAITYWRVSQTAHDFFTWCKRIFTNWQEYKKLVAFPDSEPSTDFVYAMAAQIIGPEHVTMPFASFPKIIHFKQHILKTHTYDWTRELIWEADPLRINTVAQWGAVPYHKKTWTI
jgi:hypothetical protein